MEILLFYKTDLKSPVAILRQPCMRRNCFASYVFNTNSVFELISLNQLGPKRIKHLESSITSFLFQHGFPIRSYLCAAVDTYLPCKVLCI